MPATLITKLVWAGPYPTTLQTLTETAFDVTNGNTFRPSGNDLLIILGGAAGGTYTLTTPANRRGRTGTITTNAIAAGAMEILGPFKQLDGWQHADGIHVTASVNTIKVAVIKLR